jgi:hypothetical protein
MDEHDSPVHVPPMRDLKIMEPSLEFRDKPEEGCGSIVASSSFPSEDRRRPYC